MTSTASGSVFSASAGSAVLAAVRQNRMAARAVDVECAELVVEWVREHAIDADGFDGGAGATGVFDPEEEPGLPEAGLPGTAVPMRLAGPGVPLVSDLGFTRLAAALGQSNEAALYYVGSIVELAYRLPVLWGRVRAGQISIHRARAVARLTKKLPFAGAGWVDAQVAWTIGTCSISQIERTVSAAMESFDPAQAEADRLAALEGRRFDVRLDEVATSGVAGSGAIVQVDGALEVADALDLDAAVRGRARALATLLPGTSEDVRRSIAVGDLARGQSTLPLAETDTNTDTGADAETDTGAGAGTGAGTKTLTPDVAGTDSGAGHGAIGRTVMLYLHLPADALNPGNGERRDYAAGSVFGAGTIGRCENTKSPVTTEQVRSWCQAAGRVIVRPVIDLNAHYSASTYEANPRLREQILLRDGHCRFPYCQRTARAADKDHTIPYDQGGPTSTANLTALCRRHHRAKTHAGWSYLMITPGTYLWTDPDGVQYLVTTTGTYLIPGPGRAKDSSEGKTDRPPGQRPGSPFGALDPHVARVRERAITAMKKTAAATPPPPRFRTDPHPDRDTRSPRTGTTPPHEHHPAPDAHSPASTGPATSSHWSTSTDPAASPRSPASTHAPRGADPPF
ncbi:HNH endonuclease signature motif containing protein [Ruania halotolerans]|uniref:HNH endonuclease signature motif containing protein n=1 Tax=Ruania halotolerans TaxID=2897773 RepID=UPI001E4C230A|nr:HNH endonuclease signature motif containing protein [Ruania halotolerans]UFU08293.1 HNH endonuclease [Ruania halotolerans]